MHTLKKLTAIIAMLALVGVVAAQTKTYRYVDEDGIVHYTDQPREGAEVVEIQPAQTFQAPAIRQPTQTVSDSDVVADEAFRYTSVSITQPRQGETLRNTGGNMTVGIAVAPELRRGDSVNVLYNGQQVQTMHSSGGMFTLTEVFRGEHTLQAVVVDSRGKELKKSQPVTFYMHQTAGGRR